MLLQDDGLDVGESVLSSGIPAHTSHTALNMTHDRCAWAVSLIEPLGDAVESGVR